MEAVIVSGRPADWVARCFPHTSVLALPLAGKPLVEHQLDACARAGATAVRLVGAAEDAALVRRLGDGSRWGLALSCIPSAGDAAAAALRFDGAEFAYGGRRVRIGSLRDYFEWNLRLVEDPGDCVLPGYASDHGVVLGMNVQIRLRCEVKPPVLLCDNTLVDHDCRLDGSVIVGEGAILDRGARLHRAIVFPQTYVARAVELENKIVVGARVIDPLTGVCVNLAGDVLSASLAHRKCSLLRRLGKRWHALRGGEGGRHAL